jgi:hypothetical protein
VNERWNLRLGVVGAVALVFAVAIVDRFHVGVFHDDAVYVVLAKALASGEGYRYVNLPGAPFASHFPPGYPLVLSVFWRVMPSLNVAVFVFKLLNALFFAVSAVLITKLARERTGNANLATAIGLVAAISVPSLVLVSMVLSEPLFLVLVLAVLLLAERAAEKATVRQLVVVGLLIGGATLVRVHGIVLLPAIVLALLAQRRWRDGAVVVLGALVLLVPWQLWVVSHVSVLPQPLQGNYGSYTEWWLRGFQEMGIGMIPATLQRTIPEAGAMFSAIFSATRGEYPHLLTRYMLVGVSVLGSILLARRAPVTLAFLVFYVGIVAIWPFPPSRFAWGIWPIIILVLASGAQAIVALEWRRMRWMRYVAVAAALWLGVGYARYEMRAIRGRWWASISRAADTRITSAIDWTRRNTPEGEVIASDDEAALYLYTGRRGVPVASFTTAHYLTERTPQQEAIEGLVPILRAYPLNLVMVGSQQTFVAAQYLTLGKSPRLALREQFAEGAVFTVLRR